ncbi:malate synthase A [Flavobacterium amniphilum]|uniref:malate synthase A n=1 Tax=Flavobacterium amniphilum TaxID=1834035 RepID=UPI002029FEDF|nr:malate synthase A [Flavobacterium amniphilum]MCL9805739.1 malate synthase A [Flavobacterium amniphilum]MCL9806326.1 malate synthase A [Flavobacterium amniphilum]
MELAINKTYEVKNQATYKDILTDEALLFLEALHKKFNQTRISLLDKRDIQQKIFDSGENPVFPLETKTIRNTAWTAARIPEPLLDRRVEITGPVDRKMVINALNSGAKTFMADFEDSCSPTWSNLMEGQQNLRDAVKKSIDLEQNGKKYTLNEKHSVLLVRPRGLHLEEKNISFEGELASASLVDFGLFFFHNANTQIKNGLGPYFYLPKLEHYEEARWWNEVFIFSQDYLDIKQGTIKATVLIETITASFQLDEIIYELKEHIAGLNCGRWDYIFSYIKKLKNHKNFIVPDRDQITMTSPFMSAYSLRVIQICHKRNVLAIGGMAAQIPIKNNDEANEIAFNKVITDKEREVKNGHDGTWVAHPALVPVAMKVFNDNMLTKNQMHIRRNELSITEDQLLEIPQGSITLKGIQKNINIGILYIESWLMGTGAAALYHLMEDAATAEISRAQVWLWLKNNITLENGKTFTPYLLKELTEIELIKIREDVGEERYAKGRFELATDLFTEMSLKPELDDFLTTIAYKYL